MKTPTYQDYLANPNAVMGPIVRAAKRERAEAVHLFLIAPLARFFRLAMPKPMQLPRPRTV